MVMPIPKSSPDRSAFAKLLVNPRRTPAIFVSFFLVAVIYIALRGDGSTEQKSISNKKVSSLSSISADDVILRPNRFRVNGLDVIYQFPQKECSDIAGILFFYHGCGRKAMSFFYSPQGRDMMTQSLQRGLVIVAFEKPQSCWSQHDINPTVRMALRWIETHLLPHCGGQKAIVENLPRFGFGASSGGSFIAELIEDENNRMLQLSVSNVQIMTPSRPPTKPTVFTVMSKDSRTRTRVEGMASELQTKGIPTKLLKTSPKAVTAEYLMSRFSEMKENVAKGICADLSQQGIITKADGKFIVDPRSQISELETIMEKYNSAVETAYGVGPSLWDMLTTDEQKDALSLWLIEELNVCYDQHEITSEFWGDVLSFFLENGLGVVDRIIINSTGRNFLHALTDRI